MSTKEEIDKAAKTRVRTKEVEITPGVKVTMHELTPAEFTAFEDALYEPADDKGIRKQREGTHYQAMWIAATMTPVFTAEEVKPWTLSVKKELAAVADELNGLKVPDSVIAGNS